MSNQQPSIQQRIEKDRIDRLFQRSKTASLALLVTSTVYLLLLTKIYPWQPLLIWYLVLIAVLGVRIFLTRLYEADQGRTRSLTFWLYLFRFGIFAAGATIGSLSLLFFSRDSIPFLVMAVIVPYGITVGAVSWLIDFFSFFLYVITIMAPVVYQTALAGDRVYAGTGVLTCVLIIFFLRFSREYNINFVTNTRLRYENKALLEGLEEEKNKLNNRLGRILNDSTTEIYVADAESLKCLQVNQGAVDNLGYSQDEFSGINLLDIFTDLDRRSFAELLKPLYNGRWEPVVHKGINRRKDGSTYPIEARVQLSTVDVPPIIVANVQDITERTKWEEKLVYQANYDQLTGLLNRHYMQSYMHSVFTRARRHRKKVALLFMDLDNFKHINDTLGHNAGDEVLKQTAKRISSQLRGSDTAARTGGDEFTVLLENLEENAHAEVVARKLVNMFQQPFTVNGQQIHTTVSVGISIYPDDGDSHDQLMQCADIAMYQAKDNGRNNYCFFSLEMRRSSEKQMLISHHLRYALARDELSLLFQPKINISKGCIVGAEALLRWHNSELGNISPNVFIPLAENLGLINDFGTWVLNHACSEAMLWQGLSREKLQVSVNVSPQQFRTGTLLHSVEQALERSNLPCDRLELEITESLLVQDSDKPLAILKALNDRGVSLALDDFGTGYSSLSYLSRFPLQVLKIDRSFIRDLEVNQNSKALVDAIIAMAHSLDLDIVAEGIENEKQLNFLRRRGVEIIQGYFFSPPVPAEEFRALLQGSPVNGLGGADRTAN
jgi:diguanylate cyclase (GGDEF)-like protein/PAS domain S-box-containing protein